jgi:hypothetical protein
MEDTTMKRWTLFGLIGWLAFTFASPLVAQPFTYQGFLKQNGQPVNGTVSMTFRLYAAPTGGSQLASPITQSVTVQNGLFTVELNFGTVWTGGDRYLEIQIGSTTLSPRVKVTPAPYASFAQRPWQTSGSNLFYNDGNVGIGTSSPQAQLHLFSTGSNRILIETTQQYNLPYAGVRTRNPYRDYFSGVQNADWLIFDNTANAVRVVVNAEGNVGIGTSSPSVRLSLGGDNANTKLAIWDGGASGVMGFGVGPAQFRLHLHNATNRFSFLDAPNGNELMTIRGNGNVGIGTDNPQARLHVNGGNAHFTNSGTTLQVLPNNLFGQSQANTATLEIPGNGIIGIWDTLRTTGDLNVGGGTFTLGGGTDPSHNRVGAYAWDFGIGYVGLAETLGPNGSLNVLISAKLFYQNHGVVAVCDSAGFERAELYVNSSGQGTVVAQVKNFRVPDPDDPTRDIWYGCIEGPELAMYVRGTARLVNGRAHIELPDHFRKLADAQGMTVQLTPRAAESKGLAAVRVSLDGIEVVELLNGRGNYEFDWEVKAVRKEHRDFRVYRQWDEEMSVGIDPAEAWQARLKSIQARQQAGANNKGVQR